MNISEDQWEALLEAGYNGVVKTDGIWGLFNEYFIDILKNSPMKLTQLSLFESMGIKEHNKYLDDVSITGKRMVIERAKKWLQRLNTYDRNKLSLEDRVSFDTLKWDLEVTIEGERFLLHNYSLNQLDGDLFLLNTTILEFHPLNDIEDYNTYCDRLLRVPKYITDMIEVMNEQEKLYITPPKFAFEGVIKNIENFQNVENNPYFIKGITSLKGRENETEKYNRLANIMNEVCGSFEVLASYLKGRIQRMDENDRGVWNLPNGKEYYAYLVKWHTTTSMSPTEIFDKGNEEVKKIHREMRKLFSQLGHNVHGKTMYALMEELHNNPDNYYPETDEGRATVIKDFKDMEEKAYSHLGNLFNLKPETPLDIKQVPKHEDDTAAGAYYWQGSMDLKRPGIFFVCLKNLRELPKFGMETLFIHEAVPGHHYQMSLQNEFKNIPLFRKLGEYTAYVEGWALYAEKLAYERGFYSSDLQKIGHFQDELLRAARLVIDVGIHEYKWDLKKATEEMIQLTGYDRDTVEREVKRYFVMPGQALGYKIGQIKMLELRDKTFDNLGLNGFHDETLKLCAIPLTIMEEYLSQFFFKKTDRQERIDKDYEKALMIGGGILGTGLLTLGGYLTYRLLRH